MLHMIVRNKTLHTADTDRLALDTADTFALALVLLWTYTSADCRKRILTGDDFISALKVALSHLLHKLRNRHVDRTSAHARLILTV